MAYFSIEFVRGLTYTAERPQCDPCETSVIDNLINLLFRCRHRRLSRPIAPVSKPGKARQEPYVVCLDCGKQFGYDLQRMRMGKAIRST